MNNENADSSAKPQVIDLDAEDVIVEGDRAQPSEQPAVQPSKITITRPAWIIAALVAGLLLGGWIYRDVLSTYLPSNELVAAQSRIDTLDAQSKTQAEQLAGLATTSDQLQQKVSSLQTTVDGSTQSSTSVDQRMAAVEKAVQAARDELTKFKSAPVPETSAPVDGAALSQLASRLDAVEKDVASLKSSGQPTDQQAAASTLSQAMADLKAKIASGVAYGDELQRVSRMVPAAAGLAVIERHAQEGLPNAQGLAKEITDLIPLLPKPEIDVIPENDSYTDGFWRMLRGLVTIRRIGEADWPALAAQCAALADAGDLTQAIEKLDRAEGAKPAALSQWRDRAADRLALEAAVDETSRAVLRQISTMGVQP